MTSRGSPAVIDKQDQSSDSESTKVTKVTHKQIYILYNLTFLSYIYICIYIDDLIAIQMFHGGCHKHIYVLLFMYDVIYKQLVFFAINFFFS